MAPTSRLYHALHDYLSQRQDLWGDVRHLQTLCWMIIGILQSQNVHLNGFGVHVVSRATYAQSHQRWFRRWCANRRIDVTGVHHALGYDDGVELFLHCLGRSCVSRSNHSGCLENCGS